MQHAKLNSKPLTKRPVSPISNETNIWWNFWSWNGDNLEQTENVIILGIKHEPFKEENHLECHISKYEILTLNVSE